MAFDVQGALNAGYSPAEIADFLAQQQKFDTFGARQSGYSDDEIIRHLTGREAAKPTFLQALKPEKSTMAFVEGLPARAAELAGSSLETVAEVGSRAAKNLSKAFAPEGETPEQKKIREDAFKFELADPLFSWAKSLKDYSKSVGYEPGTKLSDLADNPLNAIPFVTERVITSLPDMVAAYAATPAYITVRTKEILDERMKNDKKTLDDATVKDLTAAASAAVIEGTLERFATGRITKGVPTAPKPGALPRAGRITKEGAVQAGTETIEESAAYLGEAAGTLAGVDPRELGERALEAAIVGGGLGTGVQVAKETYTPPKPAEEKPVTTEEPIKPITKEPETKLPVDETGMADEDLALALFGETKVDEAVVEKTAPEKAVEQIAKVAERAIAQPPRTAEEPEVQDERRIEAAPTREITTEELLEEPPEIPETTTIEKQEPSPTPVEIMELDQQATDLAKQIRRAETKERGPSLATVLRNRLSKAETFDISPEPSVAKVFRMAEKRGAGENIADILSNTNDLDAFVDPRFLPSREDDATTAMEKETEAVEYIKNKIREGNYLTYETDMRLKDLGYNLKQVEDLLNRELTDEQIRQQANELIAEINAEGGLSPLEEAPEDFAAGDTGERVAEPAAPETQSIISRAAPGPDEKAIADRERDLFQLQPQVPERVGGTTGDLFGAEGLGQITPKRPVGVTEQKGQLKLFDSDKESTEKSSVAKGPELDEARKQETDLIQKALANKTPLEAAQWMAENAPNPDYRLIAKRIADRMKLMMDAGIKFDLNIATIGDRVPRRLLSSNGMVKSNLDPKTADFESIEIWLNDNSDPSVVGTTYDIVLHELVHAVTQPALYLGRLKKFAGTSAATLAKRLNDVRNEIVKHYNARVKAFKEGKGELTDFELRIYQGSNFLENADEVLAWSMSSNEMRSYMEAIPYKKTTVWGNFVDSIRQFLGLPKSKETTLSEVLSVADELFALPVFESANAVVSPNTPITNQDQAQLVLFARTNIFGQPAPKAAWGRPTDTKKDDIIFVLQDKLIDTKRVIQEIEKARGRLKDRWNAYLQEELYHGRTAKQTNDFLQDELAPLLKAIQAKGLTIQELEEFLHNRHAEERNIQTAKINPNMPDGGSGIMTADARAYLAKLTPQQRRDFNDLAKMVDDITQGTRDVLIQNGLEDPSTIQAWEAAYKNYVPLNRAENDYELSNIGRGVGQGFSVRGATSKRAAGSSRQVVDILANIAMQRERAIVRSEKTRVGQAILGLAIQHPNTDFWLAIDPSSVKDPTGTVNDLISMGINPADAANIIAEPTQTYVDPQTGMVAQRINPALRGAENVLAVRVNGKDKFVFFNTKDPRALRMVEALKNMDADQLSRAMSMVARVTRYFAAVNTQYNPIFGAINFLRDYQGAALNLTDTPIAGETKKVMGDTWPALRGIYADLRARRKGTTTQNNWAKLWDEFQKEGGQTGFRDQFSRSQERADALQRELKRLSEGKAMKAGRAIFDWLSDYNETMENAVRLAAYKAALDKGLSKQQAASVAKNLTVNFNRKGQIAKQANALYAFFNASVQGTARMYKTLRGPAGKKIFFGGLLLGSLQAALLAAAGFDEDEPPDFIKERNIIIPIGGDKYITIPMPLGFNVIPNTMRVITEWGFSGFKDTGKRLGQITGALFEMFNPIGSAGWSLQTFSPTVADPIVALAENKDWTGKPIAKKDLSSLDPTPGYTRAKETASWFSKNLAEFLNYASGGTKYRPGFISPTPDQIDYLIGQATGGVGRELMKAEQTVTSAFTGEELPSYKIPLAGRFYGETKSQAAQRDRFYNNLTLLNEHENEIKGRRKGGEPVDEYLKKNPEARLFGYANTVERQIQNLRRRREQLIKNNAPKAEVQAVEKRITDVMTRFNERVTKAKEGS